MATTSINRLPLVSFAEDLWPPGNQQPPLIRTINHLKKRYYVVFWEVNMSNTVLPAQDKENPSAMQVGARIKQHPALTSSSAFGATKKLHQKNMRGPSVLSSKVEEKSFRSSLLSSKSGIRSFGDISNRVGSSKTNVTQGLKQSTKVSVDSSAKTEAKAYEEPEYIPIIKDEEDYSDIFPPNLRLHDHHINRLLNFWEMCRKPEMSEIDDALTPQLKPRELKFDAPMAVPESVPYFERVDEDLLDLPPPSWQ
ncbi:uncharacterized protein LOC143018638 isoform X2 [Oratosquilla oratoria]|uniref:uncharacterized protein LOC143018638 isoform X2 n=2 Tax=Oratosquilla oratoria TaxID=337810 RepID=UPI003F759DBE